MRDTEARRRRCQMQKSATWKFHGGPLALPREAHWTLKI
jgi:hypothetical protein